MAASAGRHRHKKHAGYFEARQHIQIWVTEHVQDYRAVAERELGPEDAVLELGCAGGLTTALAASRALCAVGVDQNNAMEANMIGLQTDLAKQHANLQFRRMDAFNIGGLLDLQSELASASSSGPSDFRGFTAVFIDLSGSRELGPVLKLVEKLEDPAVFGASLKLVVVKAYRLACLHPRCRLVASGGGGVEGCLGVEDRGAGANGGRTLPPVPILPIADDDSAALPAVASGFALPTNLAGASSAGSKLLLRQERSAAVVKKRADTAALHKSAAERKQNKLLHGGINRAWRIYFRLGFFVLTVAISFIGSRRWRVSATVLLVCLACARR
jgi:SAM-dependent methyltransferase